MERTTHSRALQDGWEEEFDESTDAAFAGSLMTSQTTTDSQISTSQVSYSQDKKSQYVPGKLKTLDLPVSKIEVNDTRNDDDKTDLTKKADKVITDAMSRVSDIYAETHIRVFRQMFGQELRNAYKEEYGVDMKESFEGNNDPANHEERAKILKLVATKFPDRNMYFKLQELEDLTQVELGKLQGTSLFGDAVSPDQIQQGALEDCYFLTCLSSLARVPNLIKRLFVEDDLTPDGKYTIRLCDHGFWTEVVVSDEVPVRKSDKLPLYASNKDNGLWVSLIEKAYAALFSGYKEVELGNSQTAFRTLTGAPTELFALGKIPPNRLAAFWQFLDRMSKKGFFMTTSTYNNPAIEERGLVKGHSYTFVATKEIKLDNGKKELLVQLRNPWGIHEWTGDWSDNSEKWTESIRAQMGDFEDADDGRFWMSMADFQKYYTDLVLCRCHPEYHYNSIYVVPKKPHSKINMAKFEVKEDAHVYISVLQTDSRKLKLFKDSAEMFCKIYKDYPSQKYDLENYIREFFKAGEDLDLNNFIEFLDNGTLQPRSARVWLCDYKTNEILAYDFKSNTVSGAIVLDRQFKKGEYFVFTETFFDPWEDPRFQNLTFTSYSEKKVTWEQMENTNWKEILLKGITKFLQPYICSADGFRKIPGVKAFDCKEQGYPGISRFFTDALAGIEIVCYLNEGEEDVLFEEMHEVKNQRILKNDEYLDDFYIFRELDRAPKHVLFKEAKEYYTQGMKERQIVSVPHSLGILYYRYTTADRGRVKVELTKQKFYNQSPPDWVNQLFHEESMALWGYIPYKRYGTTINTTYEGKYTNINF